MEQTVPQHVIAQRSSWVSTKLAFLALGLKGPCSFTDASRLVLLLLQAKEAPARTQARISKPGVLYILCKCGQTPPCHSESQEEGP
jgi:hypothetical protein